VTSRQHFSAPYAHVLKFNDAKFASFNQHNDTLVVDEAMETG